MHDGLGWAEQKVSDMDTLIAQMEHALEGENAARPRKYRVIEVDIIRELHIEREVSVVTNVSVEEVTA